MMGGKCSYTISFAERQTGKQARVGLTALSLTYGDFCLAEREAKLWSDARRDLSVYVSECQAGCAPRRISRYRDGRMG